MRNNLSRISLFLIMVFYLSAMQAEEVWYQVEMIVFEYLNPNLDDEVWPTSPGLVSLENIVELVQELPEEEVLDATVTNELQSTVQEIQPSDDVMPYLVLPEEKYQLEGIFRVLKLSREYRPVYHIAWQQPGFDNNRAKAVHVQAEDKSRLYLTTLLPELLAGPIPDEFYEPIKLLFDGTVRIRSSMFLYVDIDLVYFKKPEIVVPEDQLEVMAMLAQSNSADYVRLNETRRIKLNEFHYFDHPSFGVIMQVRRLETD